MGGFGVRHDINSAAARHLNYIDTPRVIRLLPLEGPARNQHVPRRKINLLLLLLQQAIYSSGSKLRVSQYSLFFLFHFTLPASSS